MNNFNVQEDPRFIQGRKFMTEKSYEDAINIFSSLLQSCIADNGEMSVESAYAYYEYGNALLTKEEENPSHDVLGNVDKDASAESKQVEEDTGDNEEEEDGVEDEGEGAEEGGEGEDEPEDDLEIAWESLDVARHLLSQHQDSLRNKLQLSDVHVRLGDLLRFNDDVPNSIEEYKKALEIRNEVCENHDRSLSDVHFSLAVAHIYNASEKDSGVNPLEEKKLALEHYNLARNAIVLWLDHHSTTASAEDISIRKELSDELQESITALEAEIKREESGNGSSEPAGAVTTIGFGNASSSSSSSSAVGTSSSSSSGGAAAPMTLQVKKKRPAEGTAATETNKVAKTN